MLSLTHSLSLERRTHGSDSLPACLPPPHPCCSNVKRQLKAALQERDVQAQRNNELTQQLQDKKRQLFSAIQVPHVPHGSLFVLRCVGLPVRQEPVHPPQCTACVRNT